MTETAGVDVGQTGTRVWLSRDDWVHELTCAGYVPAEPPERATASAVLQAMEMLEFRGTQVSTLAIGSTGFRGTKPQAAVVARMLAPRVRLKRLVVADDSVSAYLGAVGHRKGVAVIAGTGAVAIASDGQGRYGHVDGYGALLGDRGGGFWLGRKALQMALRELEGCDGGSSTLLDGLREHMGCADVSGRVRKWGLEASTVQNVAAMAPVICELAHEGDSTAALLVRDAGWQLACSACAALQQAGLSAPGAAVVVGGLARSEELVDAFSQALKGRLGTDVATSAADVHAVHLGTERLLAPGVEETFPGLVDSWIPPRP